MSRTQKIIVAATLVVIAAMCLVPPWQSQSQSHSQSGPTRIGRESQSESKGIGTAGYAFILAAPDEARGIDVARLCCQVVAVVILAAAAMILLGRAKRAEPPRNNPGGS